MYISLDIETTGFDPKTDDPIEIAAVKFDENGITEQFQTLVRPNKEIPEVITHITGIRQSDVLDAPTLSEIEKPFLEFIDNLSIIGHNINFDTGFLKQKGWHIENEEYDTMTLSSILLPKFPSYSLETLATSFNLMNQQTHRALDDAKVSAKLFQKLLELIPEKLDPRIEKLLKKSTWPLKTFFLSHGKKQKKEQSERKKIELNPFSEKQQAIFETLIKALDKEKSLILEAGVETGKYVGLAEAAKKHTDESKEKICILTDSKEVQQTLQLLVPEAVIISSSTHYISEQQFWNYVEQSHKNSFEIAFILKIALWLEHTKTGNREELTLQREDIQLFEEVNHEDDFCKNEKSFAAKAQKIVERAKILLGHHDIIAAMLENNDSFLKNIQHLILVEADKFENNIEKALTKHISLHVTEKRIPKKEIYEDLKKSIILFFGFLGIFFEHYQNEGTELMVQKKHKNTMEWARVADAFEKIWEKITNKKSLELKKIEKEWRALARFFENEESDTTVILSQNTEGEVLVKFLPFEILKRIWAHPFFTNHKSLILISETLRVKKSFEYIKKKLHLQDKKFEEKIIESSKEVFKKIKLTIPSWFPEPNKEGHFEKTCDLLKKLILETSGETIALFGHKKGVHATYYALNQIMREKGISLISQDFSGGKGKILERYRKDPDHTAIIGTIAFLEKIPLPSLPCRNLIFTKLPFDSPKDAMLILKTMNMEDEFNNYSVPEGILRFLGILNAFLKSPGAEKNIYLLDSRILKKDYGKAFLDSLPQGINIVTE